MKEKINHSKSKSLREKIIIILYLFFIFTDLIGILYLKSTNTQLMKDYVLIRLSIITIPLLYLIVQTMKLLFLEIKNSLKIFFYSDNEMEDMEYDLYEDILSKLINMAKVLLVVAEVSIFTNVFLYTATKFRDLIDYAGYINIIICLLLLGTTSFVFRYYIYKRYKL